MTFLLDVNALIALMWPAHEFHASAQRWFKASSRHTWATCPLTQVSFVRIISNPAFSADAVTPPEALSVLTANIGHDNHEFWKDDILFSQAAARFLPRLVGHQQVTDAYLLGLAVRNKGAVATFDRGLAALLEPGSDPALIEFIPAKA